MDQIIDVEAKMVPDSVRAIQITERIKANGRIAVNAVCSIGKDLRTMKVDKLYTELGYEEFEDYAEKEFQLKRRQAYQYISVFEKLGEEFVQSNAQLGITKLALLAAANPEDRAEVMENNDVPTMTAKELEELLAQFKEQGEQLSLLQDQNAGLVKENEELTAKLDDSPVIEKEVVKEVIKEVTDAKTEKELAKVKKAQAKAEKELEKAKTEIEHVNHIKEQMHEEAQKRIDELNNKVAELTKAAEKPAENADKSNFKAMLTSVYKEITGLVEFIKSSEPEDMKVYVTKALEVINAGKDSIMHIEIPFKVGDGNESED